MTLVVDAVSVSLERIRCSTPCRSRSATTVSGAARAEQGRETTPAAGDRGPSSPLTPGRVLWDGDDHRRTAAPAPHRSWSSRTPCSSCTCDVAGNVATDSEAAGVPASRRSAEVERLLALVDLGCADRHASPVGRTGAAGRAGAGSGAATAAAAARRAVRGAEPRPAGQQLGREVPCSAARGGSRLHNVTMTPRGGRRVADRVLSHRPGAGGAQARSDRRAMSATSGETGCLGDW